jgi:hypothetical protein
MKTWSVERGAWSVGAGVSWGSSAILLVLVLSAGFEDEEEKEDEEDGKIANPLPPSARFKYNVIT